MSGSYRVRVGFVCAPLRKSTFVLFCFWLRPVHLPQFTLYEELRQMDRHLKKPWRWAGLKEAHRNATIFNLHSILIWLLHKKISLPEIRGGSKRSTHAVFHYLFNSFPRGVPSLVSVASTLVLHKCKALLYREAIYFVAFYSHKFRFATRQSLDLFSLIFK